MPTAFLQSPIGTLIITGDVNGISAISISDNKSENSTEIHSSLIQAHTELSEYFSNSLVEVSVSKLRFFFLALFSQAIRIIFSSSI